MIVSFLVSILLVFVLCLVVAVLFAVAVLFVVAVSCLLFALYFCDCFFSCLYFVRLCIFFIFFVLGINRLV